MITYIALLRGINVGGNRKVAMPELRDLVASLGFDDARTLLNSGNVIFSGRASPAAALERILEEEAEKRLGLHTAFFLRTAEEWTAIIERNPFPAEAKSDPAHLVLQCLKSAPTAARVKAPQAASKGAEVIRADGQQLYIVYPEGIGRSKLTADLMERSLGTQGTGRNWNTVLKLAALASG
jgi:uncharacterized protein (DUF1697 family)